jgi:Leucine-rich repeat (LRR) protein
MAQDRAHEGADDVEDEFHRRLAQQQSGQRRESSGSHSGGGSSFWRSSTAESAPQGPAFSSMNLNSNSSHTAPATNTSHHTKNTSTHHSTTTNSNNSAHKSTMNYTKSNGEFTTAKERKSSGLLGAALQSHALSEGGTLHESWNGVNMNSNNANPNSGEPLHIRHRDSSASLEAKKKDKKEISKHRAGERRLKMESQTSEVEIGHIVEDTDTASDLDDFNNNLINSPPDFGGVSHVSSSLDRSSSDQSTGSLLYGKTPNNSALLGKSSSLIFPTGVEAGGRSGSGIGSSGHGGDNGVYSEANNLKRRKINLLLDQCESVRFLKKKLVLNNLGLSANDIPVADLCGTPLGNALHKLSLAGNRLVSVPAKLVQSLPTLKHLDLSQCELHQLPDKWNLPQLKRLNLSHNRLTEFPEEVRIYLVLPYKLA